jgi:hypothetical protein
VCEGGQAGGSHIPGNMSHSQEGAGSQGNSSYARWWEARKDVGQLVSLVHDIMRQVRTSRAPNQYGDSKARAPR